MHDEPLADPLPYLDAGIASSTLISDPKSWINRRVETTEMLSQEETRRRVSIDFTLSDELLADLRIPDGVAAPITVLSKEARRNFDLRDEAGRALPVLGKQQNGDLTHIALLSAADDALPDNTPGDVFEQIAAELRDVVFAPPPEAARTLGAFLGSAEGGDPWRSSIAADANCQALLDTVWANYVLFAILPVDGPNRRILKYSYGDDFAFVSEHLSFRERLRDLPSRVWLPDRSEFIIESPAAWRAASFHAEIAIPEELRFDAAVLWDFDAAARLSDFDMNVNRASLYASTRLRAEQRTAVFVEVAPERAGRTFQSAATSVIVATMLWAGVASGLDAKNPGAAVSLLLAGAALFSGVSAVQGEHRLVRRVFAASRRWLAVVSVAALAGSASLAMEIPKVHPVGVWRVAAVVATAGAVRLMWSAVRAPA